MGFLSDIITGNYAGITVLATGIFITLFAGFSSNRKINISMAIINALAFATGIYLYITNHLTESTASIVFVRTGLLETILSVVILYAGLNVLLFISITGISGRSFTRKVILLAFSLVCLLIVIMADNPVIFTVSLILTVLGIFNLVSAFLKEGPAVRQHGGKFGIRSVIPVALVLSGLSLLAGTGHIGNISSYINTESSGDPLFTISVIVLGSALYLYFYMYPFQGTILKLSRRTDSISAALLWFLYFPAGIILLIKLNPLFSNYYGSESIYGFIVLSVLAFLNFFGAGVGFLKAFNIKRMITMLIIFQSGTLLLVRAAGFTGRALSFPAGIFDLTVLIMILLIFLPLSVISMILEKNGKDGMIDEARGFLRGLPYAGICFAILSLGWLAVNIYLFLIRGPLRGAFLLEQGIEAAILYIGFAAALVLMAVNIIRIMMILFGKPSTENAARPVPFPILFYIYISVFALLIISGIVLVIIGKFGIRQGGIELWGHVYNIFGNGN